MSAPASRPARLVFGVLAVALVALPCAAQASGARASGAQARRIERGHALAQANCSSCHAVEGEGASPNRRSPPFRTLSGQYVELTLLRKLTEIAETGHYDMPPQPVHTDEVRAIVAYINSLEAPRDPR